MADLSAIKSLDFPAYLVGRGYRQKSGTPNSKTMIRGDDRLLLKLDGGRWVFCTIGCKQEGGSILDFVMSRDGVSLGEAVRHLKDEKTFPFPTAAFQPAPPPNPAMDRARFAATWTGAHWEPDHPYLLSRGISSAVLHDPRFQDTFRLTSRSHALFPHRDADGISGLEIRGGGVRMFSKNGNKSLWNTQNLDSAKRIVICESVIDALSFHALHGQDATDLLWPFGYVSFGGGVGARQRELLTLLLDRYQDRQIIVATDNDQAGDDYFEMLSLLSPVALDRVTPISKDWNDDLIWVIKNG